MTGSRRDFFKSLGAAVGIAGLHGLISDKPVTAAETGIMKEKEVGDKKSLSGAGETIARLPLQLHLFETSFDRLLTTSYLSGTPQVSLPESLTPCCPP